MKTPWWVAVTVAVVIAIVAQTILPLVPAHPMGKGRGLSPTLAMSVLSTSDIAGGGSAVANFSSALTRLVTLVGVSGGALLALVWARVGLSWFSNDVTKKVQAKDRARDALVGTLLFTAALSGLVWGLARWVFTGG